MPKVNESLRLIPDSVLNAYRVRLQVLKKGQEYYKKDDIPHAVQQYNVYLNTLGAYYGVKEEKLDPKLFDQEKGVTEILLVSHVYWDLAKAYDRSPKLAKESVRCLDQFVKFSSGFKFQHLNAQMVRRFVRKNSSHHPENFKSTYERIQGDSRYCYVATFCYPDGHQNLKILRDFKDRIFQYELGKSFVDFYYTYSPKFVNFLEKNPRMGEISKLVLRPVISTIAMVINKCRL
jgi:hypothetical protein